MNTPAPSQVSRAAPATGLDLARERELATLAGRDGWAELGGGRLVLLARRGLVAQVWWNRHSRRYEWDLLAAGEHAGRISRGLPCGSAAGAGAALERAAAELVGATALSVVRPRLRGVR